MPEIHTTTCDMDEYCSCKAYPTPWVYDSEEGCLTRDINEDGDGDIWCEFKEHPGDDELEAILEWLNGSEMERLRSLVASACCYFEKHLNGQADPVFVRAFIDTARGVGSGGSVFDD